MVPMSSPPLLQVVLSQESQMPHILDTIERCALLTPNTYVCAYTHVNHLFIKWMWWWCMHVSTYVRMYALTAS